MALMASGSGIVQTPCTNPITAAPISILPATKKQRFIDGMRMVLNIAKESADACPPLKSCLGGIEALIKHYDEFKDVKDKLYDLIPWLTTLKKSLTEANGDPQDAERLEQLKQSLESIDKASRTLLEKRKRDRILDKSLDAQTVVKLVEQLRQAILIYQVSQQQSIHNQISKLASSFDSFVAAHKISPAIKDKISVLERFRPLASGPNSGDGQVDDNESKRCIKLSASLMEVEVKLHSLSDHFADANYSATEGDWQIRELAEEVRDAIREYQLSQQKEIYEQTRGLIDRADLTVLKCIKRAAGAGHEHRNRRGCLKGTRVALLDEIERWTEDSTRAPIFWLNGLAGTGKTAIAQTVAERCFANGALGASFFCSADPTLKNHDDPSTIFPTLAFQLAHKYPNVRSTLIPHLQCNSDIAHESIESQAEKLIIQPLQSANVPMVIVIDALDECKDKVLSSKILLALEGIVQQAHKVKFFITSRPEPPIKRDFRHLTHITTTFALHDIASDLTGNDIQVFLEHELSLLAARKGVNSWPTAAQLDLLCSRAAGHFAYAVATVKFLGETFRMPNKRCATVERSPHDTSYEGKVSGVHRGLSLDALCTSILRVSFAHNDEEDNAMVCSVLTAALFTPPFSPSAIYGAVDLEMDEVMDILEAIHSLLELRENLDHPVRPFHKLFSDCLTDRARCLDKRFLIPKNSVNISL